MLSSIHDNGYQSQYREKTKDRTMHLQQTRQLVQRLYQYDKTGELTAIKDTRRQHWVLLTMIL